MMSLDESPEFDVVVCGGGPAGICAAIAAAREGARVLLVERNGFLGGTATLGLCIFGMFDATDRRIVDGIPEEIIQEMVGLKAAVAHVPHFRWNRFTTFEPWALKVAAERLARASDVRLLYHTTILGVHAAIASGDDGERIRYLEVWNKGGRSRLRAKVFIDATGEADIVAAAGVPCVLGHKEDGIPQSPTMVFRLAGFDKNRFVRYLEDHPEELRHPVEAIRDNEYYGFCGFNATLKHLNHEHGLNMPRSFICFHCMPDKRNISMVATRFSRFNPLNADSLTEAEIEMRRQAVELVGLLKEHVSGFENARMVGMAHQLGIRESRRLVGEYVLPAEDLIQARRPDDTIALGGFPIDIHSPKNQHSVFSPLEKGYGIPYRCLWSSESENLLVAGRNLSVTHEAYGSTRIIGQCMATGQAAGVAAAWAAAGNTSVGQIDGVRLSQTLQQRGWLPKDE